MKYSVSHKMIQLNTFIFMIIVSSARIMSECVYCRWKCPGSSGGSYQAVRWACRRRRRMYCDRPVVQCRSPLQCGGHGVGIVPVRCLATWHLPQWTLYRVSLNRLELHCQPTRWSAARFSFQAVVQGGDVGPNLVHSKNSLNELLSC